jgi:hypothetical protein
VKKPWWLIVAATTTAGVVAATASSSAPPVGPLPPGPTQTVRLHPGKSFKALLPAPSETGQVWRVARRFDSKVVRQVGEGDGWVRFRAVGPGKTTVAFGLTRGETSHAYDARRFRFIVTRATTKPGCPTNLLPLGANPIGPAVTAALVADSPKNQPQVTGATIAPNDTQRGPQAKAQCGERVWRRTVVVYIVDRAFLPSQSLSQRVLFVGRTSTGYRVWQRAH